MTACWRYDRELGIKRYFLSDIDVQALLYWYPRTELLITAVRINSILLLYLVLIIVRIIVRVQCRDYIPGTLQIPCALPVQQYKQPSGSPPQSRPAAPNPVPGTQNATAICGQYWYACELIGHRSYKQLLIAQVKPWPIEHTLGHARG